ncbi:acyl-CoA hydrolase [Alkalibacillus filiformis]|uniref:Acyl-CoA hydrolase n=2 Tax=Alkalibacillus TaxID=331654 RepID=A0ABU0DW23_9BACI|nr:MULTISPECIES: acyl-CoA thioesterase [Alkalibacillus]MDQ0352565.1 acyl-CoA hydrolase [Alkalibacillus filiformis]GEN44351.1 putative acyl-CoA thioester hydrolase YkhA [Alkalibacillus haloalkaliphilus]
MEAKPCIHSLTVKNSHVLPPDTNSHGTLFGGKLMAYMDDVAAIASTRHARTPVVTASTDSVDFLAPVQEGSTICLEAFVTWTHNTSMEVFVKAITENLLTGERHVCTTAFLTMVAIDENGKPTQVPSVYPESEEEKWLHEGAKERADYRKKRREESKTLAEKFGADFPWDPTSNRKA